MLLGLGYRLETMHTRICDSEHVTLVCNQMVCLYTHGFKCWLLVLCYTDTWETIKIITMRLCPIGHHRVSELVCSHKAQGPCNAVSRCCSMWKELWTTDADTEWTWPPLMTGYSYSDLAGDVDNCKSTTAIVFFIGGGSIITCASQKQKIVALSTCEVNMRRRLHCSLNYSLSSCMAEQYAVRFRVCSHLQ
jgi:hypothetical protein